jgi:UDP-N-acetylmuramyl pentapeptide phosphotransferase/UDP-N-acetylglucosamine-1-phosphate transferase
MASSQLPLSFAAAILAALLSSVLTWAIRPVMRRHALAKPNPRSSHRVPTPQGAGIAVVAATLAAAGAIMIFAGASSMKIPAVVFGTTLFIAAVGFVDDLQSIPVLPRLLLQAAAVGAIVLTAPDEFRIFYAAPLWIERSLVVLAGLWFVNLVNFMDGLDLMTAAEAVPISAVIVLLGWLGEVPASTTIVAAALCGAMLGFAPFNRPAAKIFLGDVGSLPIGLLLGWGLLQLAWHQQFAAALLLPLYYLTDATVTLARRVIKREPFWTAHRSHFYQQATDNGFSVWHVVTNVFALNILLAVLAIGTTLIQSTIVVLVLVATGASGVALTMYRFSRPR